VEVLREVVRCPSCGRETYEYREVLYEVPHFGNTLMCSGYCSNCGYKFFDIIYSEVGEPSRLTYLVEDSIDVAKTYVVRSRRGSIASPELGFSLDPGPYAEPFITTVEGLLFRALDLAEQMECLYDYDESTIVKIRAFKSNVEKALNGEFKFTLIVEDPEGKSFLIPPTGREGKLKREAYGASKDISTSAQQ